MLAGKEFDDVGLTKVSGAGMPELGPIPPFGVWRSKNSFSYVLFMTADFRFILYNLFLLMYAVFLRNLVHFCF